MTRLEQLRIDAGLTPAELAEVTGINAETIRRIEAGHQGRPATLGRLAEYFHVPASDLMRDALPVGSRNHEGGSNESGYSH